MGTNLHKATRCIGIGLAVIVLFFAAGTALAHQSPAGCNANRLAVDLSRDVSLITSGTVVHYRVDIANPGSVSTGACDVTDLDIVFTCPAADGTATGTATTLTLVGNYPADGTGTPTCYSSGLGPGEAADGCSHNAGLACTVTVNAGVTTAVAKVQAGGALRSNGSLHDIGAEGCTPGPGCEDPVSVIKDITVTIVPCLVNADCNDNQFCTDDACVSNVCQHTAHTCAADADLCTTESCDPAASGGAGACVSSAPKDCNDNNVCTDDSCVPASGDCLNTFDETNDPSCAPNVEFCRTKGFWGTHADADSDKACSQDITSAVIAAAGGSISICGETLTASATAATPPANGNASSAIEALCVRVQGQQSLQLAAQLTAARLNCIVSGETGGACDGISINEIFDACNAACPTDIEVTIGTDTINCIDALDCFNNGGQFDNATGICTTGTCAVGGANCSEENPCATGECIPLANNCHQTEFADVEFPLPNDSLSPSDPCFEKQGPAGSSDECKTATKTTCTIIPPGESLCTVQ